MKLVKPIFFIACVWFVFLSCATRADVYEGIDVAVAHADYNASLVSLETGQAKKKPIYPKKNQIMLYLDKGVLEHYAGKYDASARDLEEAERLIQEAYTKSISAEISSYIVNDNTKDYSGEDYEDMYVNVFSALNYYHQGDAEGAGVEIRKLTQKLDFLAQKYDAVTAEMENYGGDKVSGMKIPEGKEVNFSNSALARYLSAIFYRGEGRFDDARIDFAEIPRAYGAAPAIYTTPLPRDLVVTGEPGYETNAELQIPREKARLNIIGFAGLAPVKREETVHVFFPFMYVPDGEITLPVLASRPSAVTGIEVVINGKETVRLELLENMGAVMAETFNAKYNVILAKTFIRTTIKYLAVEIAAQATAHQTGGDEGGRIAGFLAGRLARLGANVTESADIRCSRYFPGRAYVGGITLDPGVYTVTVNYRLSNRSVESITREGVRVLAGKTNLVEAVSLR
ncbi:putative lipoprotein [Treponema primitia ZAS-2]|uniref:Putative lipoprotein n=1 Tax=Treponema primitia (strain ATCC BAA-887 / DSM 12427 / ZAS-2) TaxID=545694 RepID=F5YIH2_TREPZ|nr:lipoprotein [Treponema primitia]AEF84502.1 putative lipoprotein [Treponema primitia ZAS-2]